MSPDLKNLIELETVNQEIARLQAEIDALPRRMAEIEGKLARAKAQLESAQAAIKQQESTRRALESDIQDRSQKISKYREQSLSVKTNDQYRALMHEIEFAQKEINDIEEKILVGMEKVDELQRELKSAEAELKADTEEIEKEKAHARAVTAEDEKRLAELRERREALRRQVAPGALAIYERVAAAKRSPAIAEAQAQKCSACNVMVRPQRYNELLSGSEIVTCDSCGRILFRDPEHAAAESAGPRGHERAWYYLADWNGAPTFAYFTNAKTSSSMRAFHAGSGEPLGRVTRKIPGFREAFASELRGASVLHSQATAVEDEALPPELVEELQLQAGVVMDRSAQVS